MKSVVACTPLNSISQSSIIGLSGSKQIPLWDPSRLEYAGWRALPVERLWFLVKGLIEVLFPDSRCSFTPTATLSTFSSYVSHVMPMHGFCKKPPLHILHLLCCPRKENIKARNSDAGNVATCITSRQKLCCCLGIDINWPFQSLSEQYAFCLLYFLFIQELLKTKLTAYTMKASGLGNMVKNDQNNIKEDARS